MSRHRSSRIIFLALTALLGAGPAMADEEASNRPHVAAGPYGQCYAKSIPRHAYDPEGEPRGQGRTDVYRVGATEDVLIQRYDWFSQRLFLLCQPGGETVVVRVGPWQRGHDPRADHLALAFYKAGLVIKRYSTLDIAGGDKAGDGGLSQYRNVSASVSHYSVFANGPAPMRITEQDGAVFRERWMVEATTVDGRRLVFDMVSGALR